MNRNDSPRITNKLFEITKEIIISRTSLDNFSADFLEGLQIEEDLFNLNIAIIENKYYFRGYPTGNFLKIFCKILEIWNNHGSFPIHFIKIDQLKDQTASIVENLNCQTSMLNLIFNFLRDNNNQAACKLIVNFLESIGIRGFMTILGVRMTPGSFENILPPKNDLFKSFNAIYKKREDNNKGHKEDIKYITKISVGARALSKHSDRTKDNFWGIINGSEIERNLKANQIFYKLMGECVWINIYFLPHSVKIIEVRNSAGYGIRWSLNGEFRGLIEPEENKDKKFIKDIMN